MSSIRPFALAISAATALVVMTACGDSSTPGAAPSTTSPSTSSSSSSPSAGQPAPAPTGPATVKVATTKLGEVLTDSRDFTLYKFDKDTGGTSACYGPCAEKWPPLLTTGDPQAGPGAEAGMLGTTKRTDGTTQVTYNKLPLYYYEPDKAPKDVLGQSVGGIWWVVGPDGKEIKTMSSPT